MGHLVLPLAGGLLFLIGIIFIVSSALLSASMRKKIQSCTAETTATVTNIERRTYSRHVGSVPSTSWYPTFEYYVGGQQIIKESNFGMPEQTFYIGQQVTLHYNPFNLNEYYVEEQKVGMLSLLFMVVGIITSLAGIITILVFFIFFT